jgi:single-strand DNA-binding protein
MSYNKTIIVANLGRQPELRYQPDGTAICNFTAATNRKKKNGEKITTWFRVSVWGAQGEACNQYLQKGSKVLIEGRLNPDQTTGSPRVFQRQDGTHGASYELTADRVVFMDSRGDEGFAPQQGEMMEEDDIPF